MCRLCRLCRRWRSERIEHNGCDAAPTTCDLTAGSRSTLQKIDAEVIWHRQEHVGSRAEMVLAWIAV
ncbi:MAG: hypothetical protein B7Z55_05250 [Planctomycetales bacterium 12-60-4]|nr:MAG: hypothetical protein B7Z55_05250 [Planctomycetales bacterium 12-60-4]